MYAYVGIAFAVLNLMLLHINFLTVIHQIKIRVHLRENLHPEFEARFLVLRYTNFPIVIFQLRNREKNREKNHLSLDILFLIYCHHLVFLQLKKKQGKSDFLWT